MIISDLRSTHTFVELPVSTAAFEEITEKLRKASYWHTFIMNGDKIDAIDMNGIALIKDE